jgi:hypothetical protein
VNNKKQKMDELRALQQEIQLMQEDIKDNATSLARYQQERAEKMQQWVEELVPDVGDLTLRRLEKRFGDVVSVESVGEFRAQKIQTLTQQMQRVRLRCDPEKYDQKKSLLEIKIAKVTEESAPLRSHLAELNQLQGVTRLMVSRYGTPEYLHRWWQGDFYRDWRDADAAVETTRVASWYDLQKTYFELTRAIAESDEALRGLHEELATLNADTDVLRDLQTALDTLPQHLVEWVRLKILVALEDNDAGESNRAVATINATRVRYQLRREELHEILKELLQRAQRISDALGMSQKSTSPSRHREGASNSQHVTYLHTQNSTTYETNAVYSSQPDYVADVDRGMQS